MRNLHARLTWPVPKLSTFPEINVRTYVTVDDRPGIYFFSLDADSALAVAAARRLYRLPYFRTAAAVSAEGSAIGYSFKRMTADAPTPASFRVRYQPIGPVAPAIPGTLEHWLTERYCLYTRACCSSQGWWWISPRRGRSC